MSLKRREMKPAFTALRRVFATAARPPLRGELHPQSKITDAQAAEIRATYRRGMGPTLALMYGITDTQVRRIARGQRRAA